LKPKAFSVLSIIFLTKGQPNAHSPLCHAISVLFRDPRLGLCLCGQRQQRAERRTMNRHERDDESAQLGQEWGDYWRGVLITVVIYAAFAVASAGLHHVVSLALG
jgi:hypothetical protein